MRVEGPPPPPVELTPEAQARLAVFKQKKRTGIGSFYGKCFGNGVRY
jgi:hypothetical protein